MKKAIFLAGILMVAGVAFAGWVMWKLEPLEFLRAMSPSGRLVVKARHIGEGGDPPYGTSLEISRTSIYALWTRTTIFSAYCDNPLTVQWKREEELQIRCIHPENIAVRLDHYNGTKITVVLDE
jgi:hypothetical protein